MIGITRYRNAGVLALVCGLISLLVLAPSASATWGNKCSAGEGHHCYGQSTWSMTGSGSGGGEEVMGLHSEFYTISMLVPLYESGDFVTNEQWMVGPRGGWAETGEIAGYDYYTEEGQNINGYSLHYFYAFDPDGTKENFSVYVTPWTVGGYEWHSYSVEDPNRNGEWCVKFNTTVEACHTGFAIYSVNVKVGMEAADEQQPENAGKDKTQAEFTNGPWYPWITAENETVAYGGANESAYICARNWESYPGYIEWGTPTSKWDC